VSDFVSEGDMIKVSGEWWVRSDWYKQRGQELTEKDDELETLTAQLAAVTAERDDAGNQLAGVLAERDAATERAEKAEARAVAHWAECEAWREWKSGYHAAALTWTTDELWKAREASDRARGEANPRPRHVCGSLSYRPGDTCPQCEAEVLAHELLSKPETNPTYTPPTEGGENP